MQSSKISNNSQLKLLIHNIQSSLKQVIDNDTPKVKKEKELPTIYSFQNKEDPSSAKSLKRHSKVQKEQQIKTQREFYRPKSQERSSKRNSKIDVKPQVNKKQKQTQFSQQERPSIKKSLEEEIQQQQLTQNIRRLQDIKDQLQEIHIHIREKSKERAYSKNTFQSHTPKAGQKENEAQSKVKNQRNSFCKLLELKQNLNQYFEPEPQNLTDDQIQRNIKEEIKYLYQNLQILKDSYTTGQSSQLNQQVLSYSNQTQTPKSKIQKYFQDIEEQISKNKKLLEDQKNKQNQKQQINQMTDSQSTIEMEPGSQFNTQSQDLFFRSNDKFLSTIKSNTITPKQSNKQLQQIQEEALFDNDDYNSELQAVKQKQIDIISPEIKQKQTSRNKLQEDSFEQLNYSQRRSARNKDWQTDLYNKYVQNYSTQKNLMYETNCLREENKVLRSQQSKNRYENQQPQKIEKKVLNTLQSQNNYESTPTQKGQHTYQFQNRQTKIQQRLPYQSESDSESESEVENKQNSSSSSSIQRNKYTQDRANINKYNQHLNFPFIYYLIYLILLFQTILKKFKLECYLFSRIILNQPIRQEF